MDPYDISLLRLFIAFKNEGTWNRVTYLQLS